MALGRLGGKKKVKKGFGTLTDAERKDKARAGAQARWGVKPKTNV